MEKNTANVREVQQKDMIRLRAFIMRRMPRIADEASEGSARRMDHLLRVILRTDDSKPQTDISLTDSEL